MASKRRLRRKQCGDKARHDKDGAYAAQRRYYRDFGHWLDVYQCPFCKKWHVGHNKNGVH